MERTMNLLTEDTYQSPRYNSAEHRRNVQSDNSALAKLGVGVLALLGAVFAAGVLLRKTGLI